MKLKVPAFVSDFTFEGHRYKPAADGSVEVPDHAGDALKCVGLLPWVENKVHGIQTTPGPKLVRPEAKH